MGINRHPYTACPHCGTYTHVIHATCVSCGRFITCATCGRLSEDPVHDEDGARLIRKTHDDEPEVWPDVHAFVSH